LFETRIILHRQICCQSHDIASALLGGAGSTVVHQDLPHDARCNGLDEALKEISESVRQLDFGPAHPEQPVKINLAFALIKQSNILGEYDGVSLGRFEEAAAVLERAFRIADDFVHRDADDQGSRGMLVLAGLGWAISCAAPTLAGPWLSTTTRFTTRPKSGTIRAFDDTR